MHRSASVYVDFEAQLSNSTTDFFCFSIKLNLLAYSVSVRVRVNDNELIV